MATVSLWARSPARNKHWAQYDKRRHGYEQRMFAGVRDLFARQKAPTLRAVQSLFDHHGGTPHILQVHHVIAIHVKSPAARRHLYHVVSRSVGGIYKTEGTGMFHLTAKLGRGISRYMHTRQEPEPKDYNWDTAALQFLTQRENKISGVLDNRYREIADAIGRVMTAKDYDGGSPAVADMLEEQFGFDPGRSMLIARTETTSAAGAAALDGMREGGAPKKGWLAIQDDRTRESHSEIDGEVQELDQPFSNGLMQPGDPDGPAEEVCNCRCTIVPEF